MPTLSRLLLCLLLALCPLALGTQSFFTDFVLALPVLSDAGGEAALRNSLLLFLSDFAPGYNASHISITTGS